MVAEFVLAFRRHQNHPDAYRSLPVRRRVPPWRERDSQAPTRRSACTRCTRTSHLSIIVSMRISIFFIAAFASGTVFAKLPPLSDEEQSKAAEAKAKSAWTDKVSAYKTCLSIDKTADAYRRSQAAAGKEVPPPVATPPCVDPGPVPSFKPLEAAGAHSPPDAAHAPPSSVTPQAAKQ